MRINVRVIKNKDELTNEMKNLELVSAIIHERLHQNENITDEADSVPDTADNLANTIITEIFSAVAARRVSIFCNIRW